MSLLRDSRYGLDQSTRKHLLWCLIVMCLETVVIWSFTETFIRAFTAFAVSAGVLCRWCCTIRALGSQ